MESHEAMQIGLRVSHEVPIKMPAMATGSESLPEISRLLCGYWQGASTPHWLLLGVSLPGGPSWRVAITGYVEAQMKKSYSPIWGGKVGCGNISHGFS